MASTSHGLGDIVATFSLLTNKPTSFLTKDQQRSDDFKLLSKSVFDFVRNSAPEVAHSKDLAELLISSDFDDEQVWQQLEIDNRLNVDGSIKTVSTLLAQGDPEFFRVASSSDESPATLSTQHDEEDEPEAGSESENDEESAKNIFGKSIDDSDNEDDEDDLAEFGADLSGDEDVESDLDGEEEDAEVETEPKSKKEIQKKSKNEIQKKSRNGPSSVLDDDFFKLSEMNDFLLAEEKKSENQGDSSVDLFANGDEGEEDVGDFKYADFFDPPAKSSSKKTDSKNSEMSTFERRQEKLDEKIAEMEGQSLNQKPWQLAGEVSAIKRPENSLLEEFLQFDHVTRQPPVITEEVTQKLEDLILQRVKDKAWDDVERKVKPKDVDPYEYKKKQILDEMKSKQTLSQIYEAEYLKKITLPEQTEEKEEHRKIRASMNELFVKLDALSNFHFVPKPVAPDIKIINNLPTLVVEEVQPAAVSSGQMLAPEEVLRKPREELKGMTEASSTDRKRSRRKKKALQHAKATKHKSKEERTEKEKKKTLKKAGGGSSAAFFSKLQDTVREENALRKEGKDPTKRKKSDQQISAKKFKL